MDDASTSRRLATIGLTAAIFAAPFLAFLFSAEAGLGLMAVALIATAILLREAAPIAAESVQPRLRVLAGINVALALACLAAVLCLVLRE